MMKKLMMIVLCAFMLGCTPKEQYKLDYVTDGTISEFTEITDKEPSIKEISLPSAITFFENKYSGVMADGNEISLMDGSLSVISVNSEIVPSVT